MRHAPPREPLPSSITPPELYDRRRVLLAAGAALLASGLPAARADGPTGAVLAAVRNAQFSTSEPPNSWEDITGYNNFYEFGTGKSDPAREAWRLKPQPWTVTVSGEAEARARYALEDLVPRARLEERVYRLRCVEAWSMVIPWVGVPLGPVLAALKPTSRAKYVEFVTLQDPGQMPGQRYPALDWPYREGLRIDEAMHPLALLAVGVYGRALPNQNGAPLRLVVPWKYGFKSIKSIVAIRFTERQPLTSWARAAGDEYGFYANVNPRVDHPRWSQKTERRLGAGLFGARVATLPFNGYADQVADLYRGMDLAKYY